MRKKRQKDEKAFYSPLKPDRSLDQRYPGLAKYPSAEYFRTRDVNDIKGHPKTDYFSTRWDGRPKKRRFGRRK